MTVDQGTAYGLKAPTYEARLTEVARGTPMGELLRRYWHPVGLAADAGSVPRAVRVLGEDLILFRNGQGRAGLVLPALLPSQYDALLRQGQEHGIRCCYHGWLFDVQGVAWSAVRANPTGAQCQRVRQPDIRSRNATAWSSPMGPPGAGRSCRVTRRWR